MALRSFHFLTVALCLAAAAGCSTKTDTGGRAGVEAQAPVSSNQIERAIRASYADWKGTPHRLGGNSHRGIDCSGLVQAIYRDEFAISLPRTTRALADVGRPVAKSALRAGDLVFFKPDTYPRHVGIYLSDHQFLHVSAKRGVMLSRTDSPYWTRHYWSARRVLF